MSDQFGLTKAQLKRIEPFFPRTRGIPRVDDRRVVPRASPEDPAIHERRSGRLDGWMVGTLGLRRGQATPTVTSWVPNERAATPGAGSRPQRARRSFRQAKARARGSGPKARGVGQLSLRYSGSSAPARGPARGL
jgi:hypothetical protein